MQPESASEVLDPHARRKLWATQYFVPSMQAVTSGEPLLDSDGAPLGPDNVFDAFLINDVNITAALKKMHTTP